MREFVRTTLLGGAVFLIPLVLVLFLLGYAIGLARDVLQPLLPFLDIQQLGPFGGVGALTLIAVALILLVSFIAGVFARTRSGARLTGLIENSPLGRLPQYRMIKNMAGSFAQDESAGARRVALISVEAGLQLCYIVEMLENGWFVVFVPGAPHPMSGTVMYYPPDRVWPVEMTVVQAAGILQAIGIGSAGLLDGTRTPAFAYVPEPGGAEC